MLDPRRAACSAKIFAVLLLLTLLLYPSTGAAQDSLPSVMERTGTFRWRGLTESSGVAVSRNHPGILWTHNDSGDKPVIYAVNLAGDLIAAYSVRGARAVDWEDIALSKCKGGTEYCLYVADTGDNSQKRKNVSIYVVPEPDPTDRQPTDTLATEPALEVRFRYPDGPHDTEAILVDSTGKITLITKGRSGAILRFAVRHDVSRDSSVAKLVDTLRIVPLRTLGRLVTGASLSPNGRRVVIRTYSELYFFAKKDDDRLVPDGVPCWLGAAEPQGEGVAFLDDTTLVLTSESLAGQDGTIFRVRCSHTGNSTKSRSK